MVGSRSGLGKKTDEDRRMLTGTSWVAAVAIAVFRGDRVLVLRRAPDKDAAPGVWEAISGRLEEGEDPLAAAHREVREETALEVRIDPRPVDAYATKRRDTPMLVVVYRGDWVAGEVARSAEHDDHAWLALDELVGRGVPERLVEGIEAAARVRTT
jgi:8-oxo-dGTP diphosphatase